MDHKPAALTAPQAEALAGILQQIRPEWSKPAIMAALREHYRHPAGFNIVAQAAVTAANNPANRAPCSIFFDALTGPRQPGQRPRNKIGELWAVDPA